MKEYISTPKSPVYPGLSQAVKCGNTVYISGITGDDPKDWSVVGGGTDLKAEATQLMENMKNIVEAAGGTMDSIVSAQVFFKDIKDAALFGEVYKGYFKNDKYPARMALQADAFVDEQLHFEMTAIAVLD